MHRLSIASLGLLLLGGGCRESPESAAIGRDSAGVRIVEGPVADSALPWTLTEVHRLGGADSGPQAFTTARPGLVATDARGRLYVLDGDAFHVAVFDSAGHHLETLGAKGGGPGELQFPGSLFVTPEGQVSVFDFGKQALVRFDPDGELLPQLSLQPYGFPQSAVHQAGDSLVMVIPSAAPDEKMRVSRLRLFSPRDSLEIDRDSAATPGMVMFKCVGLNIPPPFSPELAWGARGSVIAVTHRVPYVVDIYHGTRLVSSLRRTMASHPAATADVSRIYPEGMTVKFGGGGGCTITADEIIDKLGTGGDVPLVHGISIAPDSTVWVERYTFPDEPARVDVFAANGRYQGTLTGHGLPLGFVDDLVLFPIDDEATGASLVGIYRVTKN